MGRSFAYWGIPPLHIFIGEIVLAWFLFSGPQAKHGRWPWIAMKSPMLHRYNKLFLLFLVFGAFQVLHGIFSGNPALDSLRDTAFNYYPFYFFFGLWIGIRDREFLSKFLHLAAWVNGLYGILFIAVLSRVPWFMPGVAPEVAPVPIFGQPSFSAAILLGLLSFGKDLRRVLPLLLLNAAVLIGMLIRAEWLAFVLGLLVWAWATRNLKRVAFSGVLILVLFGLMYVTNFAYEGPETRGGTISAIELVARVLAPVNPDLAEDYSSDVRMYGGTAAFRTMWWAAIWDAVHASFSRALLGHGYGFPLGVLVPYLEDSATRTPHNVFFFALGYTGWIGVIIFALFQSEIARLSWRVYQKTGQPFGIVFWVMMLAFSFFTPFFETPQGAIPFYLVSGCACAALIYAETRVSTASTIVKISGSGRPQPRRTGPPAFTLGIEANS
ncbi:MAG: hypothetical protein HY204_00500 [Nitrospirae bacterium]|nr:hypothetical protein [Nitrospirota bacterium]